MIDTNIKIKGSFASVIYYKVQVALLINTQILLENAIFATDICVYDTLWMVFNLSKYKITFSNKKELQ